MSSVHTHPSLNRSISLNLTEIYPDKLSLRQNKPSMQVPGFPELVRLLGAVNRGHFTPLLETLRRVGGDAEHQID